MKENHMIISVDTEKTLGKFQQRFMIQILSKLEIEGKLLLLDKEYLQKYCS